MPDKKFNSKYSNNDNEIFDFDVESINGMGASPLQSGINIYEAPESLVGTEEYTPDNLSFEGEQQAAQRDVNRRYPGMNIFGPGVETISAYPLTERRLHFTPDPEHPEGGWVERRRHSPREVAEHFKAMARQIRMNRLHRPVQESGRKALADHATQNIVNRRVIKANLIHMAKTLRESGVSTRSQTGFGCGYCSGGTDPRFKTLPDHQKHLQVYCPVCHNKGHTVDHPQMESFLTDIENSSEVENYNKDFHARVCAPAQCSRQCRLKGLIDQYVRFPHWERSTEPLTREQTHGSYSKSKDTWIDNLLRMSVVKDQFKPLDKTIEMLGGPVREDFGKYAFGHFMNYDTVNPDANVLERPNPDEINDNERVFSPSGGGRDKQMFFISLGKDENGNHDILYKARPMANIREERRQRRVGKMGKFIRLRGARDLMNSVEERDIGKRAVRDQVSNAFDRILPFRGEQSPLVSGASANDGKQQDYYGVLRGVSPDYLAMTDDLGASGLCYSGSVKQRENKNKIRGWFTAVGKGIRGKRDGFSPKATTSVDVRNRINHGFSREELRSAYQTSNGEVQGAIERLANDALADLGVRRESFGSEESYQSALEDHDIIHGLRKAGAPIGQQSLPQSNQWVNYMQSPGAERSLATPSSVYNSQLGQEEPKLDISGPDTKVPMADMPPEVNQMLATQDGVNDFLDMIRAQAGPSSVDTPEKQRAAIEGIRQRNGIHGGFEALGIPYEDPSNY